jgi:hypothetical protein
MPPASPPDLWPELPYAAWRDTCATLHRWTQIAGKIRLSRTPWLNHSWHVPLYVNARGLTTSPIPDGARTFEIEFDFADQALVLETSDGKQRRLPLEAQSVAEFYAAVQRLLAELGITVAINDHPCELAGAIRFSRDLARRTYDPEQAQRFWKVLVQVDRVLKQFRTGFIGKCSPVHFFWGSFDLAVTRFSGRRAPPFTGTVPGVSLEVMREAYSHEVSSAGFWPGGPGAEYAAFYSYAYPQPANFGKAAIEPQGASFSEALREFLLPYDTVRSAAHPEGTLLAFLESTYEAAARTAGWDRAALECPPGIPGRVRPTAS